MKSQLYAMHVICSTYVYTRNYFFLPNFVLCYGVFENILLAKLGANEYLLPSGGNPIKIPLNTITLFENTFISVMQKYIFIACIAFYLNSRRMHTVLF